MNVRWRRLVLAACLTIIAMLGGPAPSVAAAPQPPGWTFELTGDFPDAADETVIFNVVATVATDAPAAVTYDFRLELPDGEIADLGRASPSYSKEMRGGWVADTLEWQHAVAGPYTGRVVWIDHERETVVAELRGWVGPPDAPILVLEGLETDPPTPRVSEPATVSIAVANEGQTPGSRTVQVWVWLDDQAYQWIGGVNFDAVGPGETTTRSFTWTPRHAVNGTRLGAGITAAMHGLVIAPFSVSAADDGVAAAAD